MATLQSSDMFLCVFVYFYFIFILFFSVTHFGSRMFLSYNKNK